MTVGYRGCVSPDGKPVAAQDPQGKITIYPVNSGSAALVPSVQRGDVAIQWTPDRKALLVGLREMPARVFTIDLVSRERKPSKEFSSADATGPIRKSATPIFS